MFLTDEHWKVLQPILEPAQAPRRGRPWKDGRAVLEAIFFILHTGIQWEHLPKSFPPKSTVHDRLQLWSANQAFRKLLAAVVRSLAQKGRIDLDQCFIDATFAPAKGGGEGVGLTRKGKGTKLQLIVDGGGTSVGRESGGGERGRVAYGAGNPGPFLRQDPARASDRRQGLRL